jgi:arsenite methyltransferase
MKINVDVDKIRQAVRGNYAGVARKGSAGCGCSSSSSCCGTSNAKDASKKLGYSNDDVEIVPDGANMGLGCGNPQAIAELKPGETVVDLGSGGGFDCFLAAQRVGQNGRVIGVDMTPDMVSKARANAEIGSYTNVEFRLGEIEALPAADGIADVIISNCVINLSPEKEKVFREAYRVLKSGGRLAISDVVATAVIPDEMRADMALHSSCISGASTVDDIELMLKNAGFINISIQLNEASREFIRDWAPGLGIENYVVSASIRAIK